MAGYKFLLIYCLQFLTFIPLSFQNSEESRKLLWEPQRENNFLIRNDTFFDYINQWNTSIADSEEIKEESIKDIQENEKYKFHIDVFAENVFKSSTNDSTMLLTDLTNCLTNYNFYTCMRMMLLSKIKPLVKDLEKFNSTGMDFNLFHGLVTLKWRNTTELKHLLSTESKKKFDTSLSNELNAYILRLLQSRSLQINILPGLGIEFIPKTISDQDGIVCFSAKAFKEPNFNSTAAVAEMRKKVDKKKKKNKEGGFNMMPMMIVPQMIMLGMLPFALANLKMMVMNAFMMNSMALNSAIFMTVRNMVFGPKKGPKVKYVNYGYKKKKVNKKPEIILHSPAAFIKKPMNNHHDHTPHVPNPNYVDNPNSYSHNKRRNELKERPEDLRIRNRPYGDSNQQNLQNTNPYLEHNSDLSSYENTGVDAPISYLNNNQFLNPSDNTRYPPNNNRYDPSSYESSTQGNSYESYNNVNLQSYNENGFQPKNEEIQENDYNAQYNDYYNYNNKYVNHRVS